MERRKPTHNLEVFKKTFCDETKLVITQKAYNNVLEIGFRKKGIVNVIQSMEAQDFHKSMTSYNNCKQWQDVYHVPYDGRMLYIKYTDKEISGFLLLSFKEKSDA